MRRGEVRGGRIGEGEEEGGGVGEEGRHYLFCTELMKLIDESLALAFRNFSSSEK